MTPPDTQRDLDAHICSCGHWYHLHVNGVCSTCGHYLQAIMPGLIYEDENGPFRVMTVAEGYAMCRRKNAIPFVVPLKDLRHRER